MPYDTVVKSYLPLFASLLKEQGKQGLRSTRVPESNWKSTQL